jgi:hypothetical protein
MGHTAHHLDTSAACAKRRRVGLLGWVMLLLAGALVLWPIADTPSGPSEPISGRVLRSSVSMKGGLFVTVVFPDGSEVEQTSLSRLPADTAVTCSRRQRRLSGSYVYHC